MSGLAELAALRLQGGVAAPVAERVVEELPVALRYNGSAYAVMLATPTDLDDFALGFSLSERIIDHADELGPVVCEPGPAGVVIEMAIPQARFERIEPRRQAFGGTSGCGLCGTGTLQAALRPVPPVADRLRVEVADIHRALDALVGCQPLNAACGGVHAAAHVDRQGTMTVREDVGRHNALDKLVGALARRDAGPGFVLMSSRASYEIVHKAACAGIELVVAISAPTALAIRTAEAAGITLVAFARDRAMNIYSGARRIRRC